MNAVKTLFLLMVLSGLLLMIGGIFGGEGGLMIALIFALIMNVGAYWFSDRIALGMTHAKPVTEEEDPGVVQHRCGTGELGRAADAQGL